MPWPLSESIAVATAIDFKVLKSIAVATEIDFRVLESIAAATTINASLLEVTYVIWGEFGIIHLDTSKSPYVPRCSFARGAVGKHTSSFFFESHGLRSHIGSSELKAFPSAQLHRHQWLPCLQFAMQPTLL